jgi:uncharacterized protein YeaO (DUF488 family)
VSCGWEARASAARLRLDVRRPRGVPKSEYGSRDLYDVWLPELAPSEELLKRARAASDERSWRSFSQRYRAEMKQPERRHLLDLLAALSLKADFSVGCTARGGHCHSIRASCSPSGGLIE